MAVDVLAPGLASSLQDLGRPGHYDVGIPPSGALDLFSAAAANLLVGNDPSAAVLEAPYLGPRLRFAEPGLVAVTGASMPVLLNREPVPAWEALAVVEGDVLSFSHLQAGARAYVAVAGGFDVPLVLGSRSTYGLGAFGGLQGRTLQAGDVLPVGPSTGGRPGARVPEELRPSYGREVEVRVVLGLYDHRLSDAGRSTLLDTAWELTPVADRIGFRYKGATLQWKEREQPFGAGSDPSNIVDAGYPIGSIQVPGGVEPIVLHRDAVSGGGYAMVGTVISADLDLVGQSAPGTRTRFRPVTLEQALEARQVRSQRLAALREAVGR